MNQHPELKRWIDYAEQRKQGIASDLELPPDEVERPSAMRMADLIAAAERKLPERGLRGWVLGAVLVIDAALICFIVLARSCA